MIKSFRDPETEAIYNQKTSKEIPYEVQKNVLRKLIMINAAKDERDLRIPPSNHFERLKGDRLGQVSIRINDKYRICFRLENNDCYDVEITDYH